MASARCCARPPTPPAPRTRTVGSPTATSASPRASRRACGRQIDGELLDVAGDQRRPARARAVPRRQRPAPPRRAASPATPARDRCRARTPDRRRADSRATRSSARTRRLGQRVASRDRQRLGARRRLGRRRPRADRRRIVAGDVGQRQHVDGAGARRRQLAAAEPRQMAPHDVDLVDRRAAVAGARASPRAARRARARRPARATSAEAPPDKQQQRALAGRHRARRRQELLRRRHAALVGQRMPRARRVDDERAARRSRAIARAALPTAHTHA